MNRIKIAQIGKSVGLKGELKLHLFTDFPEQFKSGAKFLSDKIELEIESYNSKKALIKFTGFDTLEDAKKLTNRLLYSNIEKSRKDCKLKYDEYFYFDILNSTVVENSQNLGVVVDIDEIAKVNYFKIETSKELVDSGLAKSFLLPYLDRYIQKVDIESRVIYVEGAFDILESS